MEISEQQKTKNVSVGKALRGLWVELRPQEWTKNLLLFSGVIFSKSLFDPHNLLISIGAFLAFCLASSGIYLFNDLSDLDEDKLHPVKSKRPLASGMLSPNVARVAMAVLFLSATIFAIKLNYYFALAIAVYLLMNLGYSLGLKRVVILDVLMISGGFLIRAVAGAIVLDVVPSEWLVLCTSVIALLIGFGKRRYELVLLEENAGLHRHTLNDYSIEFLDSMMTICAGAAIVCYALYTMSAETINRFQTRNLLLTLPFVIYGIFRYLFLIHKRQEGGDPVQLLFHDRPTLLNILLWTISVFMIIYLPRFWLTM